MSDQLEHANGEGAMKGAIISTDPEFRRRLVEAFASDAGLELGLEVDEP